MPIYQRGVLTTLVQGLDNLFIPTTIMIAGTEFSLSSVERVFTAVNNRESVRLITRFPESTEDQVAHDIGKIINISDCTIEKEKERQLSGQKRYGVSVIANIASLENDFTATEAKQQALNLAPVDKLFRTPRGSWSIKLNICLKMTKQEVCEH